MLGLVLKDIQRSEIGDRHISENEDSNNTIRKRAADFVHVGRSSVLSFIKLVAERVLR